MIMRHIVTDRAPAAPTPTYFGMPPHAIHDGSAKHSVPAGKSLVPVPSNPANHVVLIHPPGGGNLPLASVSADTGRGTDVRVAEGFLATSCRSPHSRRAMTRALAAIAHELSAGRQTMEEFAWACMDRSHVTHLYAVLAEGVLGRPERAASANQMLTALRGILQEAWRQNLRTREDIDRTLAGIEAFPPNADRRGRALHVGEILQLFRSCAEDSVRTRASRDAALLAVLYGRGLRRSEAASASAGSYAMHPKLPETMALRVLGKGNKPRHVPVDGDVRTALEAWLDIRRDALREKEGALAPDAPLFTAITKNGRVLLDGLTEHAIYRIVKRRADRAGVEGFSPHDLRRSCISDLLDAGADIAAVAALAGHASVATTQSYDRRGVRAVVSAASRLHVPYMRTSSA